MKKLLNIVLFSGLFLSGYGQQLQTSSLFDMQGVLHNPSTAGVNFQKMVGVTYRTQWSGISGRPTTATAFGSFELPDQKIGLGGYLYSDKTGPTSRTGAQLSFAKHIHTGNGGIFSVGLEGRFQQFSLNKAELTRELGNDPAIGAANNKLKADAGFGISYTDDRFQLGASVSQLVQSKLEFYEGNLTPTAQARLYRHYYFHGAYNIRLDDETVIKPNALVIYLPNAPSEVLTNVRVEHKKLFWWGVGWRWSQEIMLSAGINLANGLNLGYSFDVYRNPVNTQYGGFFGHEFMLRYNLAREK
ncbi:MAG TPA: PorP/SprF family type IX secretion system membrane protein [Lacibacter sp.]|nr:PorP/SprF family type IX secretion system membrane protein [Lacibacter sp.]HMO90142.1 PorP/SprF family type IX secretion system membrane protein [Lacibacter sp.]